MGIFGELTDKVFKQAAEVNESASPEMKAKNAAATGKAMSEEELKAVLAKKAAAKGQKYNWETSIADLMRLVDMDPSLDNRKKLASELGYEGELNGSAEMNIWLHARVMEKLAQGGGA
ncbi:MAG: DUF3597 domain-containing protein [Pseudomonadota bacterium]